MDIVMIGGIVLLAYLIGSIPTAVWVGKSFYGIDVRQHGSGNAGATNTFRVLGKKPGTIVMLVDIFKGWLASSLAGLLVNWGAISPDHLIQFKLLLGVVAVLGHIFPVYVGFKGGKGVATLMGMVLAVDLPVALLCLGIFVVVLLLTKYVSLSSMLAAISFPLLLLLPMFRPEDPLLLVFGVLIALMVVLTHKKNIDRLLRGVESKANINPFKSK
ncbi:acyl-phosphate glycerol 3-phosphate acyltransferase [Rufibacter radiotolerans]|uniref:Glycerol-3-phosphate acyltransferase n=1 Tax=Rufibacter radiotolerans TaxID=1379910 RepID=A0A0H4VN57_9BACT|nr:glycerol-3-phosphate 1-O-acyltransferase PlsY [Rufibacter radiotolerans]AKQ47350.1 acyl-phosphate glycerol 3-phosphate acyltransferase [Rufibacter radiotolerans]